MSKRNLRIAVFTVAGLLGLWLVSAVGVAVASGSARSGVRDRVPTLTTLGRRTAESMRATQVSPSRRPSRACHNTLHVGPTEVLFYEAGAVPELAPALEEAVRGSDAEAPRPVEGRIRGLHGGHLRELRGEVGEGPGFMDDLVQVLGSGPWAWGAEIERARSDLPNLSGGRYLVVALVRGADLPRAHAALHLRVVDIDNESTLCEGSLETTAADTVVDRGTATAAEAWPPLLRWMAVTPLEELCGLGGAQLCGSVRRE